MAAAAAKSRNSVTTCVATPVHDSNEFCRDSTFDHVFDSRVALFLLNLTDGGASFHRSTREASQTMELFEQQHNLQLSRVWRGCGDINEIYWEESWAWNVPTAARCVICCSNSSVIGQARYELFREWVDGQFGAVINCFVVAIDDVVSGFLVISSSYCYRFCEYVSFQLRR